MALVGPSGAGKTTVLRSIAGLMTPSRGEIKLGDHVWFQAPSSGTNLSPDLRSVGLVFQDYALFPHMTVRQNIEYGRAGRSAELMERFRISRLALPREAGPLLGRRATAGRGGPRDRPRARRAAPRRAPRRARCAHEADGSRGAP